MLTWSDEVDGKSISGHFYIEYAFVNFVGTLFPLEFKPKLNGEDFYTRKCGYATQDFIALSSWPEFNGPN